MSHGTLSPCPKIALFVDGLDLCSVALQTNLFVTFFGGIECFAGTISGEFREQVSSLGWYRNTIALSNATQALLHYIDVSSIDSDWFGSLSLVGFYQEESWSFLKVKV